MVLSCREVAGRGRLVMAGTGSTSESPLADFGRRRPSIRMSAYWRLIVPPVPATSGFSRQAAIGNAIAGEFAAGPNLQRIQSEQWRFTQSTIADWLRNSSTDRAGTSGKR